MYQSVPLVTDDDDLAAVIRSRHKDKMEQIMTIVQGLLKAALFNFIYIIHLLVHLHTVEYEHTLTNLLKLCFANHHLLGEIPLSFAAMLILCSPANISC